MKKLLLSLCLLIIVFVSAQNDNCTGAINLPVGTNFASGAITTNNNGATTDGTPPTCASAAVDNVWFKVTIPQSGNLTIKMRQISGSSFSDPVLTVYTGTCNSLTQIECKNYGYSPLVLTGRTPGETIYISIWKYNSNINNGEFQISVYDPAPPANDQCSGATQLTVGTDFNSGAINADNTGATPDGPIASCQTNATDNIWFKVIVPQNGNLKIEIKQINYALFHNPGLSIYSGTCSSLTEIECKNDYFSPIALTGQTPGTTLYINIWKTNQTDGNSEFKISAYGFTPPANNKCSTATPLTTGTDFNSGAITSTNIGATTDSTLPTCNDAVEDNVWFTVTIPTSGNLKIETQQFSGSEFDNPTTTVYSGNCGALSENSCSDNFSTITLTGQTPGDIMYVSVWKNSSENGQFKISAYDDSTLSTHEVTDNKKKIIVSPNPFNDVLTISDITEVKSVSVTDISGKLIKTIEKPSSSLDLSDLKAGLYLVTLKMKDESIKTIKTIKK